MEITNSFLRDIGKRLRAAREEKRYSQKELAGIMDVASNQYSKVENGKVAPSLKTLVKAAQALETSTDELIFGKLTIKPSVVNKDLINKLERIEELPSEERFIANELLNLIFARETLKKVVGDFGSLPPDVTKR